MVAQRNIINKVKIRVNTPSYENGMQLKENLDGFFKEKVFPEMDTYFNSIQKSNSEVIRIETFQIDISIKENSSLMDLKLLIMKELKNKINSETISRNISKNCRIIDSEENECEVFFHFLKFGILPWWYDGNPNFWNEFLERVIHQKDFSAKLKKLLFKEQIRHRLIYQFDDKQLFSIVSSVLNLTKSEKDNLKIPAKYRNQFWEAILNYTIAIDEKDVFENLQKIAKENVEKITQKVNEIFGVNISYDNAQIQAVNTDKPKFETIEKSNNLNVSDLSQIQNEGFLVENAGLILLYPFLKMFFDKLDFLSEKNIKPNKIDEAIHVLHYLATGKEFAYEHELIFEKFLCNVPFQQPINRHIRLSKKQKLASEILLQAVLEHWSALKSNSIEILQNEFLQREGKLTISEEKQSLVVARKTQDILLDKLPWNIHLIKIPWKKKILFVDW